MKTNKAIGIMCAALLVIAIVEGVIAYGQYKTIQQYKINNLNTAFYAMQEIIESEEKDEFAGWDKKSSELFIMVERADAAELIKQAKEMRVSWNTETGKWRVDIV
ncbi:MAG: hypothetical protein ACI4LA_08110 [Emergencia sp.]